MRPSVPLAVGLLATGLLAACGGSETTSTTTNEPSEPETTERTVAEGPAEPAATDEVIEGRIVGRSPLGHGDCVQQSYEVEPSEGERRWLHYEHCGPPSGPTFEALESGRAYRFTVRRGASPNYGDDPMIVNAEPLP